MDILTHLSLRSMMTPRYPFEGDVVEGVCVCLSTMFIRISVAVVLVLVRQSDMARFACCEIFKLLRPMTSFVGVSLHTSRKKISRINKETYQHTTTCTSIAQASLSEILIYSSLWRYYVLR